MRESLYGYICVRLKVIHMKHYNKPQLNLITHYIYHSVPSSPLHPHTRTHAPPPPHTHTHIHIIWQPLLRPLSPFPILICDRL